MSIKAVEVGHGFRSEGGDSANDSNNGLGTLFKPVPN